MGRSSAQLNLSSMATSAKAERWFDEELADRYELFSPTFLRIFEGEHAGKPMELIPCWKELFREGMGWRTTKDNRRWYRTLYIYIPRKNAKTTTIAALALAICVIEPEAHGQILIAASDEEQASIMFGFAANFIENDKVENGGTGYLPSVFFVQSESIEHLPTKTKIRFLSGSVLGKTGLNPTVMIIDEFQEQKSTELLSKLKTGSSGRKQPLVILIGTSGKEDDSEKVPWLLELKKAKEIKENPSIAPRYLPLIYEATEQDDPNDRVVWYKANPGMGITQDEDSFAAEWDEAKGDPAMRQAFLQYHLNIRRQVHSEFIDLALWNALENPDLKPSQFRGQEAFGGLDLSMAQDMSAFNLRFPDWKPVTVIDPDGKKVKVMLATHKIFTWYWATEKSINDSEKTSISYLPWVEQGWIEPAGKTDMDLDYIQKRIGAIVKKLRVKVLDIGYDRYNAKGLVTKLSTRPYNLPCTLVGQHPKVLHRPTVAFKNAIASGDIEHDGNPVFLHNLRNARVVLDKNEYQMVNKKECKGRIDGLAAAINSQLVFMDAPPPKPSLEIHHA